MVEVRRMAAKEGVLKQSLKKNEETLAKTGHYYGLTNLTLKEEDPIRFEVFNSRLLAAVLAAREAVKSISASPGIREVGELLFALYTPEGDNIVFSTGIMTHVGTTSCAIKWMIRNDYEDDPGIVEGDVFMNNDCTIGNIHPADPQTIVPIFWEGEIVGWTAGVAHQLEIGGVVPGSVPPLAIESFGSGLLFAAEKIGQNDRIAKPVFERIRRGCRLPNLWVMDERGKLAGCIMVREEIQKVIEEFGIDYYKRAIRELVEEARRIMLDKVKERLIPGKYRGVTFYGYKWKDEPMLPIAANDGVLHLPVEVTIDLDGKITLDLDGVSKWGYHSYNITPPGMTGGYLVGLCHQLAYDRRVNEGTMLAVDLKTPYGTLVNPDYPYASTAIAWVTLMPIYSVFSRALGEAFFARGYKEEIHLICTPTNGEDYGGMSQYGVPFGFTNPDAATACGGGGRGVKDGLDNGACMWQPETDMANAELWESIMPIVYLGRRILPDSGGYGKYRGGVGHETMHLIHGTEWVTFNTTVLPSKTFWDTGLFGGYPPTIHYSLVVSDSNLKELIEQKKPIPVDSKEIMDLMESGSLKGERIFKYGIQAPIVVKGNDAVLNLCQGGSGYGDPIERDPDLVRRDLIKGMTTPDVARDIYCVASAYDETEKEWRIDYGETKNLRKAMRQKRLQRGRPVSDWWEEEKARFDKGELAPEVIGMYKECMGLSERFSQEFRKFWKLPEDFVF
jgi:acetone carboxylase alpha subunit